MSRRERIAREWDQAQAQDRRDLPGVRALVRPGSFGTHAEQTRQGGPRAPTLDHGPLYTGEWREEIDGDATEVPDEGTAPGFTLLASLRRPWPFVGFAVDLSEVPSGFSVTVGLMLLTKLSDVVHLVGNVLGGTVPQIFVAATPPVPVPWLGMTGVYAGCRVAVFARQTGGDHPATVTLRADLWGYNAPGYGP